MITGPNGFLYNQLTMEDSDDLLFLLGAPTTDNKVMLDEYVQTTKDIIRSNRHKYTVFASTAWIEQSDDYYNKSKKELELFIEENCSKYLILKITYYNMKKFLKKQMEKPRQFTLCVRRGLSFSTESEIEYSKIGYCSDL